MATTEKTADKPKRAPQNRGPRPLYILIDSEQVDEDGFPITYKFETPKDGSVDGTRNAAQCLDRQAELLKEGKKVKFVRLMVK